MYKQGDIVLIKSCAGEAIPAVEVRLLKKIEVKPSKGRVLDWPGSIGWECELTKPEDAAMLRKKWSIPFLFPDDIETFVFERDIVKYARQKRKRPRQPKKTTI